MPKITWQGQKISSTVAQDVELGELATHNSKAEIDPQDNLLIRGDNLLALKALTVEFAGRVKMIYTDPPYNTGNTSWVYNDHIDNEAVAGWVDQTVSRDDPLRSDKWLCMMQPRVQLMRELLAEDGVACFSIDDAEYTHLKDLLELEFGHENHVATIIWKTKGSSNDSAYVSTVHEYIIIFAKNIKALKGIRWQVQKPHIQEILAHAQNLLEAPMSTGERSQQMRVFHQLKAVEIAERMMDADHGLGEESAMKMAKKEWGGLSPYVHFDEQGVFRPTPLDWPNATSSGPRYDLLHPDTGKPCRVPKRGWRLIETSMLKLVEAGRIMFGVDEMQVPQRKLYLHEAQTQVLSSVITDITGLSGTQELEKIFGERAPFPYPKPTELICRLIEMITDPGDIVLDAFGGSGTTAHAVLRVNALNDLDAPRQWILIQRPEKFHDKDIYTHITRVRLNRVIAGYETNQGEIVAGLGGSYVAVDLKIAHS